MDHYLYKELLNTFVRMSYSDAYKAGWWDKPTPLNQSLALIGTELAEAIQADRTDAMDIHLPEHLGLHVELADAVIYTCSLMGKLISKDTVNWERKSDLGLSCVNVTTICDLYIMVSRVLVEVDEADRIIANLSKLIEIIRLIFGYASSNGIDLVPIVFKKLEYNRSRIDHTAEHRDGMNGKKY